jgi:hypothetical protein
MSEEKQEFQFDKFVEDLEERESAQRRVQEDLGLSEEEWQTRELQKRYREHPLNRRVVRSPRGK